MSDYGFRVVNANKAGDKALWLRKWNAWEDREIHAHPEYVKIQAREDGGIPLAALWSSEDSEILYPFLLRDLRPKSYWQPSVGPATDIISPYGYGGPFVVRGSGGEAEARPFWETFDSWARGRRVVTEFVRFSLFDDGVAWYPGEREAQLENVVRDLALTEDELWMDVAHKVRKNVKRARREGVEVAEENGPHVVEEFAEIYAHTMDRNQADERYRLGGRFFENLHEKLGQHLAFFHARHEGRSVAAELVLISANSVYSFLGGTLKEAFRLRANDILKWEITTWAKRAGKRWFVLGGGAAAGDGIFRYKKGFSPAGIRPFHVGRRVLDQERYDCLNRFAHGVNAGGTPNGDFFPLYRAPGVTR